MNLNAVTAANWIRNIPVEAIHQRCFNVACGELLSLYPVQLKAHSNSNNNDSQRHALREFLACSGYKD
jgi:hypothetical protein